MVKIQMLADYFKSLIKEEITYSEYLDFTDLIDKLVWTDVNNMKELWFSMKKSNYKIFLGNGDKRLLNRLSMFGIGEIMYDNSPNSNGPFYYYDDYSRKFISIGIFGENTKIEDESKEYRSVQEELSKVKDNMLSYVVDDGMLSINKVDVLKQQNSLY